MNRDVLDGIVLLVVFGGGALLGISLLVVGHVLFVVGLAAPLFFELPALRGRKEILTVVGEEALHVGAVAVLIGYLLGCFTIARRLSRSFRRQGS